MTIRNIACILLIASLGGCKKYLDVPLPITEVTSGSAFNTDNSAAASLNSIYFNLYADDIFDGPGGVGTLTGLYTDELANVGASPTVIALYTDQVTSTVGGTGAAWTETYQQLFSINTAIEQLTGSSLQHKDDWLGEAYFMRALCYFYLTNLYGDVPLALTSNYAVNNTLTRSPQADVYTQIVADLKTAQGLLGDGYHDMSGAATNDRGRPNRMAVTALLARVDLYMKNYADAIVQADTVIADAADYQLPAPAGVFLMGSPEIIWGIVPGNAGGAPYQVKDAPGFYLPAGATPLSVAVNSCLSDSLVAAFEPGDQRYAQWTGADTVTGGTIYHYAYKYKAIGSFTTAQEDVVLFRLAEQYLIRAEARANTGDLAGAAADLNAIRARAGLAATTAATAGDLVTAILKERRVELFAEEGHRLFDLRRTGNLDALLTVVAPQKGGSWSSYKEWWPIPVSDLENDTHLTQTPGYQ